MSEEFKRLPFRIVSGKMAFILHDGGALLQPFPLGFRDPHQAAAHTLDKAAGRHLPVECTTATTMMPVRANPRGAVMEEALAANLAIVVPCPALGTATHLTRYGVGGSGPGSISRCLFRHEERENGRFLAGDDLLQLGRQQAFAPAHMEGITFNGNYTPMGT